MPTRVHALVKDTEDEHLIRRADSVKDDMRTDQATAVAATKLLGRQ
jgi:hypothetical protein